jgi:hypothetical protein
MSTDGEMERMQPSPQRAAPLAPAPAAAAGRAAPAPADRRTKVAVLVGAILLAAALGTGAVTTGLVHVPGFNTETSMPAPSVSQGEITDVTDNNSKTVGAGLDNLTLGYAKSHKLATQQTGGYVVTYIMPRSPAEDAKLQVNDSCAADRGCTSALAACTGGFAEDVKPIDRSGARLRGSSRGCEQQGDQHQRAARCAVALADVREFAHGAAGQSAGSCRALLPLRSSPASNNTVMVVIDATQTANDHLAG